MFLGVVSAQPTISSISVTPDPPLGIVPLGVTLTATTTGTIDTYSWNLGNGTIINTTINTLTVNYVVAHTNGVYTISLTVNDTSGAVSTAATLDILARPDCPSGDGTCLFVPQDRCATQNKGIRCFDEVAIRYCEEQGYVGYDSGSMSCDAGGNYLGSSVGFQADGSEVCSGASVAWILSLRCLSVGTCTENDTSTDLAEQFVFGKASEGGVDWLDSCIGTTNKLNESYCDINGQLAWKEVTCSEGCSGGVCKTPGLYCEENTPVAGLPEVPPESRDRADDGDLYYCGLDEVWHKAKPTIEDISCVAAGTCPSASKCLASYECISNSCVDEYCISITTELQEQRNILQRIWCFLTNMGDFFGDKFEYCECLYPDITSDDYNTCTTT